MGYDNTVKITEAIESSGSAEGHTGHERCGSGHINDTFLVINKDTGEERRYVLQRMNHEIFRGSASLVKNVENVAGFLREKITANGRNPYRETLNLVRTKDDGTRYMDSSGNRWGAYLFTGGAACYNLVEKPEGLYQSGRTFGHFQRMLADYPTKELSETTPDLRSTPVRFETFKQVVKEDMCGRAASAQEGTAFVMGRTGDMEAVQTTLEDGRLPLRATHNDTKLSSITVDGVTGKALCIIGLDTIMSGLSTFDFGDSIRFRVGTAEEDETDLSEVSLSLSLFNIYTERLLGGYNDGLAEAEVVMLPMEARLVTLGCGVRFLMDCLQGDTYFKIHREHHNLGRIRTQFGLMTDMEKKWIEMEAIVKKYQ